jgi:hypothetical protein
MLNSMTNAKCNGLTGREQLRGEVEELKGALEEEGRLRALLGAQARGVGRELGEARGRAHEEAEARAQAERRAARLSGEVASWRARCEGQGAARDEEAEEARRRWAARWAEAERQVCVRSNSKEGNKSFVFVFFN